MTTQFDLENDIRRRLASAKGRDKFDGIRQVTCRINPECHHQLGVLAVQLNMTRASLAEHLLEQATAIAWQAADLSEADINATNAPAKTSEAQESSGAHDSKGGRNMAPDETKFSRMNCFAMVFRHLGVEIGESKESEAVAVSRDGSTSVCGVTSKDYAKPSLSFWLTIFEHQLEDTERSQRAYIALGCGSTEQIVVIPTGQFRTWCDDLPPYTKGKTGWHIQLRKVSGRLELRRAGRRKPPIDITAFLITPSAA